MYRLGKRIFDIISSSLALVVLSPVFLLTAVGIEVSDPGPCLYRAARAGQDNRIFRMYKFRSMRVEEGASERSLRPDRDRIFPFGRFIRRTKIDELPQLINVIRGEMSVVGPRPAAVEQLGVTRGGDNRIVASVKPGLASPASLYDYIYGDRIEDEGEYMEKVAPTRLALDRYYIGHRSARYDARLIWQTVRCILGSLTGRMPMDILEELVGAAEKGDGGEGGLYGKEDSGEGTEGHRDDPE